MSALNVALSGQNTRSYTDADAVMKIEYQGGHGCPADNFLR